MTLRLDAAARSHIGLVCQRNEDTVYSGRFLFAVADGLGGHVAGDIASSTVTDAMYSYDRPIREEDLPAALGKAVHAGNMALRRMIAVEPNLAGMGTTLVALLTSGTAAVLANVGDSRAYLLRDGQLAQLSEDHTYANLVAEATSVPNLPDRIARFLDGRPDGRSPDITMRVLRPGDRYLLCSDGVSSVVPPEVLQGALESPQTPRAAAEHLVEEALHRGGPDNATVIVVDVSDTPEAHRGLGS